jgi:hypothetical protein
MDGFGFPVIAVSCIFGLLAITAMTVGIALRLTMRWAYHGVVALSSLALLLIIGLVIHGFLSGRDTESLLVLLLGLGFHSAILLLLKAGTVEVAFGPIQWQKVCVSSLCTILVIAWLFLAIVQMTVEGRKSIHLVLKPYPTLWSIYVHSIDRLPRDEEGFVQKSQEKIWHRNWNYLLSYQIPFPLGEKI